MGNRRFGQVNRLPGKWQNVVAPELRDFLALQSGLGRAGSPHLCFAAATLLVIALARPGLDTDDTDKFAALAGRVIILDVGSDLARHRHFIDEVQRADPGVATAVIASSGDAYRIVPFTTSASQVNRYARVLNADMMPEPGQNPHRALALADRMLDEAGYAARQTVLVTARRAPETIVEIPAGQSRRYLVPLAGAGDWRGWADAQDSAVLNEDAPDQLTRLLRQDRVATMRSELPSARTDLTPIVIAVAALLWLFLFRRRAE